MYDKVITECAGELERIELEFNGEDFEKLTDEQSEIISPLDRADPDFNQKFNANADMKGRFLCSLIKDRAGVNGDENLIKFIRALVRP